MLRNITVPLKVVFSLSLIKLFSSRIIKILLDRWVISMDIGHTYPFMEADILLDSGQVGDIHGHTYPCMEADFLLDRWLISM